MKYLISKYYQPFFLFVLTFAVASIFSTFDIDPHHQGVMFKPAFDVAHGQMLFRDTFTVYGALTTLLQAWALRIFGDYLVVIQLETAFFYALISVCLYYLWLNIIPRWLTVISVIIWLLLAPYYIWPFHPWSSVYALFFQLLSLILVLQALREKSRLMMILTGCVAILTFWCRQPVGICHCAAIIFFLAMIPLITGQNWNSAMKNCIFFIAGMAAVSATFLLWFYLNGAIHDMYLQSIKAAFSLGSSLSRTYNNLFIEILTTLFLYNTDASIIHFQRLLPLVCLFILAIFAVKRWSNRDRVKNDLPLYGILIVSLASWMQYYPSPCMRHGYWAATPMIGLFSYGAWQLCNFKKKNVQIIAVCLILASVFGFETGIRIMSGYKKITAVRTKIEEPKVLRGMYLPPAEALTFKTISMSLNKAIRNNPFPYLVNLTYDPLYSTFIGPQKNFHPAQSACCDFWYIPIYPEYTKSAENFINIKHPLILWYEDTKFIGWNRISLFNISDAGQKFTFQKNIRIALYRFAGNNKEQ